MTGVEPHTMAGVRGVEFDGWAVAPPPEPWGYDLDDFGVIYGDGWWPFHRHYETAHRRREGQLEPEVIPGGVRPTSVRISPDTAYQSWRNFYTSVEPGPGSTFTARLTLHVGQRGMGADVYRYAIVRADLASKVMTVEPGRADSPIPAELVGQAKSMATKVLRFVLEHRKLRESSAVPLTAWDKWHRGEQEAGR